MISSEISVETIAGFALSPPQRATWLHLERGVDGLHCHAIAGVLAEADPERIRQRLATCMAEQEILRTRFQCHSQLREPVHIPEPFEPSMLKWRTEDWRHLTDDIVAENKHSIWQRALQSLPEIGIDACVARLPNGCSYLALSVHALTADVRTLCRLFAVAEGTWAGSDDAIQYADLAAWLDEVAIAEENEVGRRFWRMHDMPEVISSIALECGKPTTTGHRLSRQRNVPLALSQSLSRLAEAHGLHRDDLYFGGWLWLLRALGNGDVMPPIARIMDGVTAPELEASFGPLQRMLPFSPAKPFAPLTRDQFIRDLRDNIAPHLAEMREYQECSPPGSARQTAPYVFQSVDTQTLLVDIETIAIETYPFRCRATVWIRHDQDRLVIDCSEDILSMQGADCFLEQWLALLNDIIVAKDDAVLGLALDDRSRQRLLDACHGPVRPIDPGQNVVTWMQTTLAENGSGFVIDSATYPMRTLNERANRLARLLRARGLGRGDIIGLHVPRSSDYVVAMLATLKCGAAYMPMDVDYPRERLSYMLATAQPALVLADEKADVGAGFENEKVSTLFISIRQAEADAECHACHDLDIFIDGEDLAYVLFTSGSTGKPKGVSIPHRALYNHMSWMLECFDFKQEDIFLQRTSSNFDASVWEFWAPMLIGGTMVVFRQERAYDLAYLIDLMKTQRVSIAQFVPSLLETLLEYEAFISIDSIETVFCGGEALTKSLKDKFFACSNARLSNLYGPTECCIDSTYQICGHEDPLSIGIGKPIDNTAIVVVDKLGRPAGFGIIGEICIGGAGLFKGYIRRDDLTAEKVFIPTFSDDQYYLTGDLGRVLMDGSIEYFGRIDQQIKLNGHRIELSEINAVITSMPGVRRAVTAVNRAPQLITFVQIDPGTIVDSLLDGAHRHLPDYMIPARIVPVDNYPSLPNGKLDYAELRRMAEFSQNVNDFELPRTATECVLASIWGKVLRRDAVGINDRFFSVGGDSIRSIQIVYEAGLLGYTFTVMDIFSLQTIRALAEKIDSSASGDASTLRHELPNPAPAGLRDLYADAYPATEMQRYMIESYAADTRRVGIFHAQQGYRLRGADLDINSLSSALMEAAKAQNFRTRFVIEEDDWYQVVVDDAQLELRIEDFVGLGEAACHERFRQAIERDRKTPFDPFDTAAPLMRVLVHRVSADTVEILVSNHHAIQDGWGNVEFMNRVGDAYRSILENTPIAGSEGANVCKEFALLQHALLQESDQIAFWESEIRRYPQMPPALERVSGRAYTAETAEIDPDIVCALMSRGLEHNLTQKSLYLTAFADTLDELGMSVVIGVVSNGRSELLSDPFRTMGLFWNLMPFWAAPMDVTGGDRSPAVQDCLLAMEPYSRFPLRRIERIAGHGRLIGAYFNYVNFHNLRTGHGQATLSGIHALDNFGVPIGISIGVNGEDSVSVLIQQDIDFPHEISCVQEIFTNSLKRIAFSAATVSA